MKRESNTRAPESHLAFDIYRNTTYYAPLLMQTKPLIPSARNGKAARSVAAVEDELADFSTNRRVLLLSAMAVVIGAISSLVAYALIWLIAAITNLAFYHRFSAAPAVPQGHHLGLWVVLVPVAGALLIRSEEHTSELQSLRHLVCRL